MDEKEDTKEDKKVAASAASAASVGQRLSGGYLALKLQALLQDCPSAEDSLATPGLRVFEHLMLGEGTYGMVCQAEYRGEAAAAKVLTFTDRMEKTTTGKKRRVEDSTDRLESARCEVADSSVFSRRPKHLEVARCLCPA